jgi:uncharacterized protein (TIGR00299 family) protein
VKLGYFDCFSGASGDMILGALLDVGLALEELRHAIDGLGVPGLEVKARQERRGAFIGTRVEVVAPAGRQPPRHLADILALIEQSALPPPVQASAGRVFRRLAEAEAKVHGSSPERIHFHEVGALDSIADIIGSAYGVWRLGLDRIACSPLNLGSGWIRGAHGTMPVPAPGTVELLRGIPAYGSPIPCELTTPTGAAVLSTLAEAFGPLPEMTVSAVGYGAGGRDLAEQPNLLRLIVGEATAGLERDRIRVIEANIDDMSPELYEPLMEALFAAGALDVALTPLLMKKARPGTLVTVLAPEEAAERCAERLLRESTTFGLRMTTAERRKLHRRHVEVETPFGRVRVKCGSIGDEVWTVAPEYDDCRRVARARGIPVRAVLEAARAAAEALRGAGRLPAGEPEA